MTDEKPRRRNWRPRPDQEISRSSLAIAAKAHAPRAWGMNGTERAYKLHLTERLAAGEIVNFRFEPMRLILAKKTSYLPDFLVQLPDGSLEFHEVKGHWRDDARVKIKVAAEMFPEFRFIAAEKNGRAWKFERF